MADSNQPIYARMRTYIDDIARMSRRLLAANAGISESKLSLMLAGKRKISIDDYERLCLAMSVDPGDFYRALQPKPKPGS